MIVTVESAGVARAYARELRGAVAHGRRRGHGELRRAAMMSATACGRGSARAAGGSSSHHIATRDRPRAPAHAHRLAGADRGARCSRALAEVAPRAPRRRRRRRRHHADAPGLRPVARATATPPGRCRCSSAVLGGADFSGKRSTPYAPGSVHDFMHAKITVIDDVVFVGSLQPVALGRGERRERARDRATPRSPTGWPRGSTRIRARYPARRVPLGGQSALLLARRAKHARDDVVRVVETLTAGRGRRRRSSRRPQPLAHPVDQPAQ